jgi:hypothetical protein
LADVLNEARLDDDAPGKMLERFKAQRWLALGGAEVALPKYGSQSAMLYIPGKVPLPVSGHKQIKILERLVAAHKAGSPDVPTGELVEDTGVKSPPDAWPSAVRKSVVGVYFENSRRAYWRLKIN